MIARPSVLTVQAACCPMASAAGFCPPAPTIQRRFPARPRYCAGTGQVFARHCEPVCTLARNDGQKIIVLLRLQERFRSGMQMAKAWVRVQGRGAQWQAEGPSPVQGRICQERQKGAALVRQPRLWPAGNPPVILHPDEIPHPPQADSVGLH